MQALERGRRFVAHDVWHIGMPGEEIPHGFIIKHVRVAILLAKGLVRDDLLVRAAALTFATMLSIVPFLAIMFFVIQTFGIGEFINKDTVGALLPPLAPAKTVPGAPTPEAQSMTPEQDLRDSIVSFLFRGFEADTPEAKERKIENAVSFIKEYAERGANPRTLTLAGVIFVLTTVFGLMMNIESSFNTVWGVRRSRSWYRMCSDYLMILLLMPFLVSIVLSVTAALKSSAVVEWLGPFSAGVRGIQYALCWGVFAVLYYVVPNARVKFRYALFAGIVAGTLWNLLSMAYVKFQFNLPANLVYSTFAQLPVLLLWAFASWLILLGGAELAFAYQNEKTFAMERLADSASYAYREVLGVCLMFETGRRFDAGLPGLIADAYARDWNVPTRLVNDALRQLESAHLLVQSAAKPPSYQPARSLGRIPVAEVVACLREAGRDPSALRQSPLCRSLFDAVAREPHESVAGLLPLYEQACRQLPRSGDSDAPAPEPSDIED